MWQCLENSKGLIDTLIMTVPMTARQCVQDWGLENVGESIVKAYEKNETQNDIFNIIHLTRPRAERDETMIDSKNMPFESVYVSEKDDHTIEEGGYEEFPFAVPRYRIIFGEVYGRGQGSIALRAARTLNRAVKDFDEAGNKWVNPPLEVLDTFDGDVDVSPGAQNWVTQLNSIQAIDRGAIGAFPIGKDWIEYRTQRIQEIFFKNVFEQLAMLTGDRRTTVEIIERLKEGMKKMSKPIGRLFVECYDPTITRSVLSLVRNGAAPPPPPELQGQGFKIEYIGPLALALRDQQSKGLQYWIAALGQMEPIFPGVKDNVDHDKAARDLGESLGVKTDHIRPIRDRDAIRQMRQEAQQAQLQVAMLEQAAKGYKDTTSAAEKGSPAEQVQSAMQGAV
jgi:flagellar biosynthesis chaperone FliJ